MENHIVRRKDLQLQLQEIQLQLRGVKSHLSKLLKTIVQITCAIVAKQYYVPLRDSQNNRVWNGECEKIMTEF